MRGRRVVPSLVLRDHDDYWQATPGCGLLVDCFRLPFPNLVARHAAISFHPFERLEYSGLLSASLIPCLGKWKIGRLLTLQ